MILCPDILLCSLSTNGFYPLLSFPSPIFFSHVSVFHRISPPPPRGKLHDKLKPNNTLFREWPTSKVVAEAVVCLQEWLSLQYGKGKELKKSTANNPVMSHQSLWGASQRKWCFCTPISQRQSLHTRILIKKRGHTVTAGYAANVHILIEKNHTFVAVWLLIWTLLFCILIFI